jgi:hypothetical protein
MKKLLALLLLIASPSFASYTTRFGLDKIDDGTTNWGGRLRANYDTLDSSAAIQGLSNTFTTFQTFSSSISVSTVTVSQLKISTPTYSGTEKLIVNGTTKMFGPLGATLSLCDQNGQNCSNLSSATISGVTAGTGSFWGRDFGGDWIEFKKRFNKLYSKLQ